MAQVSPRASPEWQLMTRKPAALAAATGSDQKLGVVGRRGGPGRLRGWRSDHGCGQGRSPSGPGGIRPAPSLPRPEGLPERGSEPASALTRRPTRVCVPRPDTQGCTGCHLSLEGGASQECRSHGTF